MSWLDRWRARWRQRAEAQREAARAVDLLILSECDLVLAREQNAYAARIRAQAQARLDRSPA